MTSGNYSEEPIATENTDAFERLTPLADAFLVHNRDIHIRCDDSVVRVDHWQIGKKTSSHQTPIIYLRRSRAYSPYPVSLPFESVPSLAVGGELKNTFCLTREHYAFLSQHIGDMENVEIYDSFEKSVEHLSRLFRVKPEFIAYDMHPGYFTTKYAEGITAVPRIAVQHHHAHIAAGMADNGLSDRKVIGLSFDGTGYGTDGKIWGGEVLLASYADFERVAHLEYLPLPGGDAATHHPWRIAVGYAEALGVDIEGLPFLQSLDAQAVDVVRKQVQKKLNAPETSSMGRLFDAVACLTGIRNDVSYEAQAAMELEVLSKSAVMNATPYPFEIEGENIRLIELFRNVIEDVRKNRSAGFIGARFHQTMSAMAVKTSQLAREKFGINEVVLSGGVWQNQVLLDLARTALTHNGFIVFTHQQTPANDGGLALGQAAVASFKMKL
jgi:hydrogenase maturation protein HypF